jgi:hypothetical protein
MLVRNVGNGLRDRGAIRSEDGIDLVLGDQLLIEPCRGLFGGYIVVDQEFDRPPEQTTLRVQMLLAQQVAFAAVGLRAMKTVEPSEAQPPEAQATSVVRLVPSGP